MGRASAPATTPPTATTQKGVSRRDTQRDSPIHSDWSCDRCVCVCVCDGVSRVILPLLQASGFTVTTPNSTCARWRRFAAPRPTSSSTPSKYLRTKTGHYRGHPSVCHVQHSATCWSHIPFPSVWAFLYPGRVALFLKNENNDAGREGLF